jgi:hypothetical protein
MKRPVCWFASFPDAGPCDGRLIRAHLVKQQVLRREGHGRRVHDHRSWVWCCGGPTGIGGHHAALDHTKRLRIPLEMLPPSFLAMMEEIDMTWYVTKHYGEPRS